MTRFIGREYELGVLSEPNWRDQAVLAAVYGRRRVGKTALVEQAYRDCTLWKFEGLENTGEKTQLALFRKELSLYTRADLPSRLSSWDAAFRFLDEALVTHTRKSRKPIVVFFDEFQWMCGMRTTLVSLFKYHWDNHLSRHPRALFVICGSVSSFIVKKVIQSRALYGRVDIEIPLQPLPVADCSQLLPARATPAQCLETYMIFGGIPQYWLELNPRMSLTQNLNEYAFRPAGYFFKEFDRLFISHFASHPIYEKVLREVAEGPLTPAEIAVRCDTEPGGGLTRRLEELVLAGFLRKATPIDKRQGSRLVRYKLDDEYVHFYFAFIAPRSADIVSGNVGFAQAASRARLAQWQGYAFERLCRKHSQQIASHLRFSGINYRSGEWFRRPTARGSGAQVDLLFVRADKVLTLCEAKYVDRLALKPLRVALSAKIAALGEAFPNHAIETVLLLGKDAAGRAQAARDFDRVLLAEDVFLS